MNSNQIVFIQTSTDESSGVVSQEIKELVVCSLKRWNGELMPISLAICNDAIMLTAALPRFTMRRQ